MLTEVGTLIDNQGERAVVLTTRGEACSSCGARSACNALGGGKEMRVVALNYILAKEGDCVELALPESSFLKASVVTYLLPLLSVLAGAVLGQIMAPWLGWSADTASIVLAGLGLALSLLAMAWINRWLATKDEYIPRIVKVLPPLDGGGTSSRV